MIDPAHIKKAHEDFKAHERARIAREEADHLRMTRGCVIGHLKKHGSCSVRGTELPLNHSDATLAISAMLLDGSAVSTDGIVRLA